MSSAVNIALLRCTVPAKSRCTSTGYECSNPRGICDCVASTDDLAAGPCPLVAVVTITRVVGAGRSRRVSHLRAVDLANCYIEEVSSRTIAG